MTVQENWLLLVYQFLLDCLIRFSMFVFIFVFVVFTTALSSPWFISQVWCVSKAVDMKMKLARKKNKNQEEEFLQES